MDVKLFFVERNMIGDIIMSKYIYITPPVAVIKTVFMLITCKYYTDLFLMWMV